MSFLVVQCAALPLMAVHVAEETAANNENISSTGAQKLSHDDIAALREAGLDGRVSCHAIGTSGALADVSTLCRTSSRDKLRSIMPSSSRRSTQRTST